MKIAKVDAIGLMVALGFKNAGEWDTAKLTERLDQLPEKVKADDVPVSHREIYETLANSDPEDKLELVDDDNGEEEVEEASPAKKARSKPAADEPIDVAELNLSELKALVEERQLKVKASEMKNVEVLRSAVKKALKTSKGSRVDKAVDRAAKRKGKAAEVKRGSRAEKDLDEFGSAKDSIRGKVNAALKKDWQTAEEIAKTAGVQLKQARSRLRRAARKGLIEVERKVSYRLISNKK